MDNLVFKYYSISEFPELKNAWKKLENGKDMTYFQTYRWHEILWGLNRSIKDRRHEIGFGVIEKNDNPIMIAPLWIVKKTFGKYNKKGFYLFGRNGWSDYLNFIYKDFDSDACRLLLEKLTESFGICDFYFENLPEASKLYNYLKSSYKLSGSESQTCVGLSIDGKNFEEYHKSLSKQSRQNIRTARNRLVKDEKSLVYDFDDRNVNLHDFMKYRNVRVAKKNDWGGKTLKWRIINFISTKILKRGWYKFPDYAPFTHDSDSRFMTAKTSDGELCAAFNYGIDHNGRSIVLMAVSTNPDYQRYSPGIQLLFNFIENAIAKGLYDYIDFTRGNEPYKFALGGTQHSIHHISFSI